MPIVVTSAAVAGRKNNSRSVFVPSIVNPFKRRRTLEESIAEETPKPSPADGPSEEATEAPNVESQGGALDGEPSNKHQEAREGSNPDDGQLVPPRTASGNIEWHENQPGELGDAAAYVDDDEPYFLTTMPYRSLVRRFALVPITACFTVMALVLLLHGVWSPKTWSSSFASYLRFFILASAAWILSFAFRFPLYLGSSVICHFTPFFMPFFSTLVQVFCEEVLRLCVLVVVNLHLDGALRPSDPAFPRVWALAMGWAIAEVAVSVWQGYEQLALYKDILSPARECDLDVAVPPSRSFPESRMLYEEATRVESAGGRDGRLFDDAESFIYREIEQIMHVRARLELEEVYGIPVPNIPVFISCLQRIDSIILSLALFLNVSSSYLLNVSRQGVPHNPHLHVNYARAIKDTIPTLLVIVMLHTFLSFIWSANILPRIGVHSASYTGLVLSLGALFAGLGRWDAL